MTPRINDITIKNFRGIQHQRIALKKGNQRGLSLLLIGENGTGKSSVVDALDYFFNKRLERFRRNDVSAKEGLVFQGARDNDPPSITLAWKVNGKDLEVTVKHPYKRTPDPLPGELIPLFELAENRPFILRRAAILTFIKARGAERYQEFSKLIGLDELDAIENVWREERNRHIKAAKTAKGELDRAKKRLQSLLLKGTKPVESDVLSVVNDWLRDLNADPIADLDKLTERLAAIPLTNDSSAQATELEALAKQLAGIQALMKSIQKSYRDFYHQYESFIQDKALLGQALMDALLREGERVLKKQPDLTLCPLCRQPVVYDKLLAEIAHRREELAEVQARKKHLDIQLRGLREQSIQLRSQANDAKAKISALEESISETSSLHSQLESLAQTAANLQTEAFSRSATADDFPKPEQLWQAVQPEALTDRLQRIIDELNARVTELQPAHEVTVRTQRLLDLQQLGSAWQEYQRRFQHYSIRQSLADQIEQIYQTFLEARETHLTTISNDIRELVNAYYKRIHPGEGHAISIPIQSGKQVGLDSEYLGVSMHPIGLFSEGHLDTLGLVIFLAFIKKFNGDLKLLVLDDVLTTVDGPHRQRVASLLAEEFADYQLIITTHDRLWGEQLASTLLANHIPFLSLHLSPWDKNHGMQYREFVEDQWDLYREVAQTVPALGIAGAGRDLEKFLNIMRYQLELQLPAKFNEQYTIGDLWDPFKKWWKDHYKTKAPTGPDPQDLMDEIKRIETLWKLRNWSGAHYNTWAATVTTPEAIDFIDAIEEFVNQFRCPTCRAFFKYERRANVVACSKKGANHIAWPVKGT